MSVCVPGGKGEAGGGETENGVGGVAVAMESANVLGGEFLFSSSLLVRLSKVAGDHHASECGSGLIEPEGE